MGEWQDGVEGVEEGEEEEVSMLAISSSDLTHPTDGMDPNLNPGRYH